jgi:TPR repeat protein
MNNLAILHYNGLGTPINYIKAHSWWNISAFLGDQSATKNRESARNNMTPSEHEEAQDKARIILQKVFRKDADIVARHFGTNNLNAIPKGKENHSVQNKKGMAYFNGTGVLQDYRLAYAWWGLSARNGSKLAKKRRDILKKIMTSNHLEKAIESSKRLRGEVE